MSILFVDDDKAKIGISGNRLRVSYADGLNKEIPMELIDNVGLLGNPQMTTQAIQSCLQRGIPVTFFSKGGKYFGRLLSTGHVNTERQRLQCSLYETPFALDLAKRIISAKIKNQIVVLQRYERSKGITDQPYLQAMESCRQHLDNCSTVEEVMGHEGRAAREYFLGLAKTIEEEFIFHGRSRRPPLDEFNSLLSLGYSVLLNVLYNAIEVKGLNPYFGFIHKDREKHPTLASDLMEAWRPVIVDSLVMSMINGHEIHKDDFYIDQENPGCYLTKSGLKVFLAKLENKLQTKVKYLRTVSYAVSFRQGIYLQIDNLLNAMENEDAAVFQPIEIR